MTRTMGRHHRPRLSQHFLVDRGVAARIVDSFAPEADDQVVEIGPGRGVLTQLVAPLVARLVAVELDAELASSLSATMDPWPAVSVLHADALRVDITTLVDGGRPRVLSNLPYSISTPFILGLLEHGGYRRQAAPKRWRRSHRRIVPS